MNLSLQKPGDHYFIRSANAEGIRVGENLYTESLLLSAEQLISDWPVQRFEELRQEHLQALFDLEPDVILLGTGSLQKFPPAELMMEFHRRQVGIEVMGTAAACRTFNVLVSESRRVLAALMPLRED